MLFVDEFCGILVYIKFGADVTSQYLCKAGGLSYPLSYPTNRRKNTAYRCMGTAAQMLSERA